MLPAFTDARQFLGQHAISYSEMQKLSHCDVQWDLIYNTPERESYPSTPQMELGTELHRLLNIWWDKGAPLGWDKSEDETAVWLMQRYNDHYMAEAAPLQMLATNVPFAVWYNGTWLFGWFDGIVKNHETGDLWVAEFKSMGNWSKLHQLPQDKQVSLYIYAARRSGYDVKGVMFDALLTTVWKTVEGEVYKSGPRKGEPKDFHPPADSFRREWVVRTPAQIQEFLDELDTMLIRRIEIRMHTDAPVRNVGQACDWCPVMGICYGIDLTLLPDYDEMF